MCPVSPGVVLDSLSHHAVSCRHSGDTIIRHNKLRGIIADLCRKAHLSVRVEAGHGMCRDNNHSHQADVLAEGWERGQPAALDITVTSPLTPVSLSESSRIAGVAALSAETRKHATMTQSVENWDGFVYQWQLKRMVNGGKEAQHTFSRLAIFPALKSRVLANIYGHLNICLGESYGKSHPGKRPQPNPSLVHCLPCSYSANS